jgi:hypothetical protein
LDVFRQSLDGGRLVSLRLELRVYLELHTVVNYTARRPVPSI